MDIADDFHRVSPFEIRRPVAQTAPFVFNSPHSGRHYPAAFLAASRLDPLAIRRSEDAFVDELFADVVEHGVPLVAANFPRAYLDVNREPYELDPKLIADDLPSYANSRTPRVVGGLGTVARVVGDAVEIYSGRIPLTSALDRIERLYKPYHAALRRVLAETHVTFGAAILIDCHSMPTTIRTAAGRPRGDFILGDRDGKSCAPELTDLVETVLIRQGYTVVRNKPYAGGFITEHYGRPAKGLHALQIEINRGLYLDEIRIEKRPAFARLKAAMGELAARLTEMPAETFEAGRLAAE